MKNLFKSLAVVTALSIAATSALASEGAYRKSVSSGKTEKAQADFGVGKFYLKGLVGWNFAEKVKVTGMKGKSDFSAKGKNSFKFGAGVGYEVAENLRTELVLNYAPDKDFKKDSNTIKDLSVFNPMVYAHYDFGNMSGFTPFASVGLGMSYIKFTDVTDAKDKGSTFSYGAGVGVGYELSREVIAELSYFYTQFGSKTYKNAKGKFDGHSVNLGFRFKL